VAGDPPEPDNRVRFGRSPQPIRAKRKTRALGFRFAVAASRPAVASVRERITIAKVKVKRFCLAGGERSHDQCSCGGWRGGGGRLDQLHRKDIRTVRFDAGRAPFRECCEEVQRTRTLDSHLSALPLQRQRVIPTRVLRRQQAEEESGKDSGLCWIRHKPDWTKPLRGMRRR
jgi:hypothetical protein